MRSFKIFSVLCNAGFNFWGGSPIHRFDERSGDWPYEAAYTEWKKGE